MKRGKEFSRAMLKMTHLFIKSQSQEYFTYAGA
jgi:hypothetical protein